MKNLFRLKIAILSLSMAFVVYAEEPDWRLLVEPPALTTIEDDYYKTSTTYGKNKGSKKPEMFLLGHINNAGTSADRETVTVRARGGDDVVFADQALTIMKRAQHSPYQWATWGCDVHRKTCLVGQLRTINQGVVAYMGSGNDVFYGSPHGDVAFTGSSDTTRDPPHDTLFGYEGDDVLVANGSGGHAQLLGGAGTDLLINRKIRKNSYVSHTPGVWGASGQSDFDFVITGRGTDHINIDGNGETVVVIGFEPKSEDSIFVLGTGEKFYDRTVSSTEIVDFSNDPAALRQWLPNVQLLGHSFTLSPDAVGKQVSVRRYDDGVKSSNVYFVPFKDQPVITSADLELPATEP